MGDVSLACLITCYAPVFFQKSVGMSHNSAMLVAGFDGIAYFLTALIPMWCLDRVGRMSERCVARLFWPSLLMMGARRQIMVEKVPSEEIVYSEHVEVGTKQPTTEQELWRFLDTK